MRSILVLALAVAAGSVSAQSVSRTVDESTKVESWKLEFARRSCAGTPTPNAQPLILLLHAQRQPESNKMLYMFVAGIDNPQTGTLGELVLLADSTLVRLVPMMSAAGPVQAYGPTRTQLETLAHASHVRGKIEATAGPCEFPMDSADIAGIRKFTATVH